MMRQRMHDQEGASATMFVIVLLVLLGAAMLAVDGGNLFVSQRLQVADTDAAALAAARLLAEDNCASQGSVTAAAERMLEGESEILTLTTPPQCAQGGVVTVESTRDPALFFAPVFGYNRTPVVVRSQAEYGYPDELVGVRPIAICEGNVHYQEFLGNSTDVVPEDLHPSVYPSNGTVHRIVFQRLNADGDPLSDDCSDAAGNWGWLDFDSGGNSGNCDDPDTNNELACRIRQGYEGPISLITNDCNVISDDIYSCPGQSGGGGNSTSDDLDKITCQPGETTDTCPLSLFVIFRAAPEVDDPCYVDTSGNGQNARFCLVTVVPGVLWDHSVGRGRPTPDDYLDIEFLDVPVAGVVGGSSNPGGTAPQVYSLCGARDFSNCATATP